MRAATAAGEQTSRSQILAALVATGFVGVGRERLMPSSGKQMLIKRVQNVVELRERLVGVSVNRS
ncbi:hypothetical protein [Streptomyces sp. TP-A0356]|uniref:hypothetical protein n=1 Tax=Streptomyces sp. TP-A0356 TaxID=1359208 RepID=UPI000D1840B6|nr:hypothetical protein [Streptomyces sp. TP-A0356]